MRHAKSVRLTGSTHDPAGGGPDAAAVEIWTDGACKGNPGPGGWGAWMRSGTHEKEIFGGARDTTNNRMELTAVIEALSTLKRRCRVILHTDSQYVQLGVTQWLPTWIRRGWKTAANQAVKNADLWQTLAQLAGRHDIDWRWVRGHAGNAGNERADELANRGVEQVLRGSGQAAARGRGC